MGGYDSVSSTTFYREAVNESPPSVNQGENLYFSEDYETYFIEYVGDFERKVNAINYARVFPINAFFAVLFVKEGRLSELLREFPEITNTERSFPYTLLSLEDSNEAPNLTAISKGNIPLDGSGVVVGIIGKGIDYLNPRFMNEDGSTRIISIWDQSISTGPIPENFFHGTEYTREEINRAIQAQRMGQNPYDIVNHKDENGYSTAIANIIGGRKQNENDSIVSIAPKCEFIVIKLKESRMVNKAHWGLEDYDGLVFDSVDIAASGRYLNQMQQKVNKPLVMFLSIGTNLGAHDGSTLGERYVDFFAQGRTFSVVTSTGNQGGSPICLKLTLSDDELEKEVSINVDENQKNIFFSIYYSIPDKVSIGITSPTGETITRVPIEPINGEEVTVNLGETSIFVHYFLEGRITGTQEFNFVMKNVIGGVWKVKIRKRYSIHGTVNIWMQQKEFSVGSTGLQEFTPYTTLMTPGTSNNIIVASSYDEAENRIMEDSGRGFTADNRIIPAVALSAKNVLSIGLGNKPKVVTGSAVSGAILTGAVALLYQWGIVERNDLSLYAAKIKSYLIQGTLREQGKAYPNEEVGFGVLNIEKMYQGLLMSSTRSSIWNGEEKSPLYISIPWDIYKKLKKA
ncbi:S8 family peptidase [Clostridium tunisiense]|uniref:S8 family peptidase n=1 Tax=Clostridium tunisiense TaxID=219748 RepID=UPI0002DCEF51|nr:S8 family peptidase [Clostridium tunisiense]